MSTTPRTDAFLVAINGKLEYHLDGKASADVIVDAWKAMVNHARQLERELTEANKKIEALKQELTMKDGPTLYRVIDSMDLRELMITTHPETPVV